MSQEPELKFRKVTMSRHTTAAHNFTDQAGNAVRFDVAPSAKSDTLFYVRASWAGLQPDGAAGRVMMVLGSSAKTSGAAIDAALTHFDSLLPTKAKEWGLVPVLTETL